ncbi:MAG: hypothetical protein ACK55I_33770, partial [bacterium]
RIGVSHDQGKGASGGPESHVAAGAAEATRQHRRGMDGQGVRHRPKLEDPPRARQRRDDCRLLAHLRDVY